MIFEEKTGVCPCCGKQIEMVSRRSSFVPDVGMDQKPSIQGALPVFYHCQACNFCGTSVKNKSDMEVQIVVGTPMYKEIWERIDLTENEKQYLSAMKLAATPALASDLHMCFCWYLEFEGKKTEADEIRTKAVEIQKAIIAEKKDFDMMLQCMDSLRQLGRMEEALAMIADVKPLVNPKDDPELVKLLIFEKQLIVNNDREPHFQSEVD